MQEQKPLILFTSMRELHTTGDEQKRHGKIPVSISIQQTSPTNRIHGKNKYENMNASFQPNHDE